MVIPPPLKHREPPRRIKNTAVIRYVFTPEEIAERAITLSQACTQKNQLVKEKKTVMDDFKSKESELESKISNLSNKIENGYEMRNMRVETVKDFDAGWKFHYEVGTDRELQRDKLTAEDYQLDLEETEAEVNRKK
jgi:hypothetical protein